MDEHEHEHERCKILHIMTHLRHAHLRRLFTTVILFAVEPPPSFDLVGGGCRLVKPKRVSRQLQVARSTRRSPTTSLSVQRPLAVRPAVPIIDLSARRGSVP
jgi:hypothetical protein